MSRERIAAISRSSLVAIFGRSRSTVTRRRPPGRRALVQLGGKAGDCYLFSHALWHGPAPNHSGKGRKSLLYNYAQMFLKAYDFPTMAGVMDACTPRQRRLLGDLGHAPRLGDYFYVPEDQEDVMLQRTGARQAA